METKKCSKCGIKKPLSEFGNCSKTKDKKQYYCRECHNAYMRQLYIDKKLNALRMLKKTTKGENKNG